MPAGISAWTPLANITLGSNASTVTFSSISQSYRDLVIVCYATTTGTAFSGFTFNNDTANNYNMVWMQGNGSSSSSAASTSQPRVFFVPNGTTESGVYWNSVIQILDYSATDKNKSGFSRVDNAATSTNAQAFRWNSNSAISTITFVGNNQPWAAGSTFALYGVSA